MIEVKKIAQIVPAASINNSCSGTHRVAVTFDDGYQSIFFNALPILIRMRIPATIFIPAGFIGKAPAWIEDPGNPSLKEKVMTESQLRELPKDLITIGSHTSTHPYLSKLSKESIVREISESKNVLEIILSIPVDMISIPYGDIFHLIKHEDLFNQAGYKKVFLSNTVPLEKRKKNYPFFIGRTLVTMDDWPIEYRLKFMGAYQWLHTVIRIKKTFQATFVRRGSL